MPEPFIVLALVAASVGALGIVAALVAIALHLTEPVATPTARLLDWVEANAATLSEIETRQPTGLQRLADAEPLVIVQQTEWMVTTPDGSERFITLTEEGEYATSMDATHPTLDDAVAAIVKAAS